MGISVLFFEILHSDPKNKDYQNMRFLGQNIPKKCIRQTNKCTINNHQNLIKKMNVDLYPEKIEQLRVLNISILRVPFNGRSPVQTTTSNYFISILRGLI